MLMEVMCVCLSMCVCVFLCACAYAHKCVYTYIFPGDKNTVRHDHCSLKFMTTFYFMKQFKF